MNTLCTLLRDWAGDTPDGGVWTERKFDGFRCLWFRGIDGKPRLWTRNGMPIEGCDHIAYRLSLFEKVAGCPLFIDGELVVDGTLAATKHWVETGWRQGGEKGVLHAFDMVNFADWKQGGGDAPLYARKARLVELAGMVDLDPSLSWEYRPGSRGDESWRTSVDLVEDFWLADAGEVVDRVRQVWSERGEGLVIKDFAAPYQRKRSPAWRKVTRENISKWSMT
jgi:ATP-dependent DNA ligase